MEEGHYSAAWLAAKLFCDRTNVYKILARSSLDSDTLYKISFFLRYDFFALYSREISRIKTEEDRII
ncbi:MAG: XRE family transcriptional regulator [Muribaculaceae bacterium]|nr:XRE family transcriptional regulator [Muribaculaceae bacterium]